MSGASASVTYYLSIRVHSGDSKDGEGLPELQTHLQFWQYTHKPTNVESEERDEQVSDANSAW